METPQSDGERAPLPTFKKLPLGGIGLRELVAALAAGGARAAETLLAAQRPLLAPRTTRIADDAAVLVLGGSNGITRCVALQLLLGERATVFAVHKDSEKMQIGPFHVQAMQKAADEAGVAARFFNADATKPATIEEVVAALKERFRCVHLVNGIAAGATKRYAEHGPTLVKDVDVAFHPLLQTPDFSRPENIRKVGMVEVEIATEVDIERTNTFMGTSSLLWAEPLARAGLFAKGESLVAFCDYDYPPDDPVYAMGPLAGAKQLQRKTMAEISERFGVRTARLCYPPVATTALGAIPGGLLMYAMSSEILLERGEFRDVLALGKATMAAFGDGFTSGELRLDTAYQATMAEFHRRKDALTNDDLPGCFAKLIAASA